MNTKAGGQKINKTIKARYGEDYYRKIGALGGKGNRGNQHKRGFASMDKETLRLIGIKGGSTRKVSR